MITYETQRARRLVGCLSEPTDIVAALRGICRAQRVTSGRVVATGYLADATFLRYDAAKRELEPEREATPGPLALVALSGTISQGASGTELSLFAHVADARDPSRVRAGALHEAEVRYVEFELRSVDDVDFVREPHVASGLAQWSHLHPHGGGAEATPPRDRTPSPDPHDLSEPEDHEDLRIEAGDVLEHPKLGACLVMDEPDGDRVSVQLSTGRIVELHLGLVQLTLLSEGTRREYALQMRRR